MLKKKVEKEETPVKKKPIQEFFAMYLNYAMYYQQVDDKGKLKYKSNIDTGNRIYDGDGNPIRIMKRLAFENLRSRMSQGYLSVARLDPNLTDPQNIIIGENLWKLAKKGNSEVYSQDAHEKRENHPKWIEKQRRQVLESENADLKIKASKVEELEKRLAAAEKKG